MKVLLSWLRDFVDVPGTAEEIGRKMSLRGLALEGVEPVTLDGSPPAFAQGASAFAQGATADRPAGKPGAVEDVADAILDFEVTANRPDNLSMIGIAREIATAYGLPLRVPGPSASGFLRTPELRPAGRGEVTVAIEAPDLCARYAAAAVEVTPGPSPAWMQARLRALDVRPISNIVDITNYVLLEMGQPLHAFDATKLAGAKTSSATIVVRRARPGETLTTLDGKGRALNADMLVIADAARASAIAGVMGGADSEVTAQTRKVILESAWFKPQSVRATSKALGLRTEASYRFERGADLTGTARAMARATALVELTGAGTASGTIVDVYPTPHVPSALTLTAEQINGLLGMDVPHDEVERILASLGFDVRTLGGWHAAAPDAPMPVGVAGSSWQVTVPGWRVDIARPVDLVEEVGRHHGFEHLPSTFPGVEQAPPPSDWRVGRDQRVRRTLLASGFSEAVTFAFIEEGACAPFAEDAQLVRLANPLSEKFAVMRPSLIPGLIDAVSHNRRRERRDIRLFEIGTRFSNTGEVRAAAFAWTGLATPDHWSGDRRDVDFFDVKGVVEQLCATLNVTSTLAPTSARHLRRSTSEQMKQVLGRPSEMSTPRGAGQEDTAPSEAEPRRGATRRFEASFARFLVDGRAAEILIGTHVGEVRVGIVGLLDPTLARAHDVPDGDLVYVAELDLDTLSAHAPSGIRRAEPLPRHPSVVRDIAILIDDGLSAESVRGTIQTAAPLTLVGVREFDRYQGKGIPEGKVSLALRLTFQAPDRTLTDEEVLTAMDRIAGALRDGLGAVQR